MAKHIGIVACSAEGAALCFQEIARYSLHFMGKHLHPQITMSCIAMGEWMPAFDRGDYEAVAAFMVREAEIVARAGADFAICPDNSAHRAFPFVAPRSPIPFLHIADEVAKAAAQRGYRHSALLGTRFTMSGPVYPESYARFNLDLSTPRRDEQTLIDDVIFNELVNGVFKEESRLAYNEVVARMKKDHGCDSVILGCTEIPLLVQANDCPLPTLDSTRLLAHAAVHLALGQTETPSTEARRVSTRS